MCSKQSWTCVSQAKARKRQFSPGQAAHLKGDILGCKEALRKTAWQRQKRPWCEPKESQVGPAKPCALAPSLDLNLQAGEKVTHKAQGLLQPAMGTALTGFGET